MAISVLFIAPSSGNGLSNSTAETIQPAPAVAYSAPAAPAHVQQRQVAVASVAPPKAATKTAEAKAEQPSKFQRLKNMVGSLRGSNATAKADPAAAEQPAAPPQQQVAQQVPGNFTVISGSAAPLPSASFESRFGSVR